MTPELKEYIDRTIHGQIEKIVYKIVHAEMETYADKMQELFEGYQEQLRTYDEDRFRDV